MGIQQLSQPIVGVLVVDMLHLTMMGFAQLAQPRIILITVAIMITIVIIIITDTNIINI